MYADGIEKAIKNFKPKKRYNLYKLRIMSKPLLIYQARCTRSGYGEHVKRYLKINI